MNRIRILLREFAALLCVLSMCSTGLAAPLGQDPQQDNQQQAADQPLLTPDQLDDLVTPIALYADPLIAQILAASTYPLEVVQADRWLQSNMQLQGTALTQAAAQQPWDPSIQALVIFPSVLSMMDKNLQWTTDLGNAFLGQEQDVMDAIQRQRQRASSSGKLASNYVVKDSMIGGFAMIAFPAEYAASGVKTFIVNQDDVVWEKDLGPKTTALASTMKSYDPGPGWVESPREEPDKPADSNP